jgi:hypothetical protein
LLLVVQQGRTFLLHLVWVVRALFLLSLNSLFSLLCVFVGEEEKNKKDKSLPISLSLGLSEEKEKKNKTMRET